MYKRLLSLLLILVAIVFVFPVTASADIGDYTIYERESNNYFSNADTVYDDTTVSGGLSQYDIDCFKITVSSRTTISVISVSERAIYLSLEDSYDDCLSIDYASYSYSSSGYYYNAEVEYTVSPGTYYIQLLSDDTYSWSNDYLFYVETTHTHYYSTTFTTPATCTSPGYTTYMCACGESYDDDYVNAKGHTESNWIVESVASCTQDGYKYKECTVCEEILDSQTTPKSHTKAANWVVSTKPTAGKAGVLSRNCTSCRKAVESVSISLGLNNINGKLLYINDQGNWAKSQWVCIKGFWYYFESDGYAVTNNWKLDSKGWCYLLENGQMAANCWIKDSVGWCYVGADGYCVVNCWMKDSYGWCYLDSEGRMATNRWILDSVGWCYVGADGYCVTNCWMKDSYGWCYLDANGRMVTDGWVMDSVGWCYLGADGYAVTNCWKQDSVGWCYLDANGSMVKDTWEMDSTGWHYIDANGYLAPHELDYHYHYFSAPTYTSPSTCSCGAVRGEALDFPITLGGYEPFYIWDEDYTQCKLDNFYYVVTGDSIKIYFDAEKVYQKPNCLYEWITAKFKLFDADGYLIDDAWFGIDNLYVGEKVFSEYVYLDLDYWDGYSPLTLVVTEDY